jgi:hypothetical protein
MGDIFKLCHILRSLSVIFYVKCSIQYFSFVNVSCELEFPILFNSIYILIIGGERENN